MTPPNFLLLLSLPCLALSSSPSFLPRPFLSTGALVTLNLIRGGSDEGFSGAAEGSYDQYQTPYDNSYDNNNQYDPNSYDPNQSQSSNNQYDSYSNQPYSPPPSSLDSSTSLLSMVSSKSISLIFFLLMWRAVHHYELADSLSSSRLLLVVPTILLFLANLYAFITSFLPPAPDAAPNSSKKLLKPILNANKLTEALLLLGNLWKLLFAKPKRQYGGRGRAPPAGKEAYVGGILVNALYIALCHLMTKVSIFGGDGQVGGGGGGGGGNSNSNSNNDWQQQQQGGEEGQYREQGQQQQRSEWEGEQGGWQEQEQQYGGGDDQRW